ncbi:ribonucleoside-diphosphate reductase, adenosylcobalamin-dependent [Candidatus Woesearchaeota archaeon CG10_big_fil_rev_8_21_14_0_10_37_12]|nr:MAG: ribonucleoside-diphosphate reductase, adenosylcobalamin-dependent [Candidatus Woesearchaeota archaeon CG10_big_fil_rev_8_21_14_0_10_37_12]
MTPIKNTGELAQNWDTPPFGKIPLTENQQKVIKDKYLRDDPSVEYWLWNVAKNIAIAELTYLPEFRHQILNGVRHKQIMMNVGGGETSELLLIHVDAKNYKEQEANHKLFIQNLYKMLETDSAAQETILPVAKQFYDILANFDFLPNSPTLMNASRELQQLSACYVLPIEDSIEGWGETAKHTMLIHKSGGGTGFSSCRVRPRGDAVKSTKGVASGALSPLAIINHATQEVKQGGTRRGANMGILPSWHPDVFDFISYKVEEGKLENFNISVAADEEFMTAVKEGKEYSLRNPRNKEIVKKINAQEMFDMICNYAWKTGDPGMIWLDRINQSKSNPTPKLGEIESTNPCGEQPLLPYEPCNLGSINLSKFVVMGKIDYSRLGEVVKLTTRFLDNVIEVNNYPIPEIEMIAKGNRRIGLGVMGWAEMLALLNIPYDSEEALQTGEEVMKFINDTSLDASEELAKERGVFPNYKDSIYHAEGQYFQEWAGSARPRNCARTTIAPTGTIAICAGLQGGGIEPFFSIVYTRYNAKALDALKKGETPNDSDVFHEVNPLFKTIAAKHNYFELKPEELWKKIEKNHNSVRGIKDIPEDIQRAFASSHDVPVEYHVKHQGVFQKHTDNGVSKTINLPNSATVDDVKNTYLLAWKLGCKGITVYRDGCKSHQVLNISEKKEKKADEKIEEKKLKPQIDPSEGIGSVYYQFETSYGPVHVHIDHHEGEILKVFTNIAPLGTEISGLTAVLGILITKFIENGGDVNTLRKHLNSVKSDKPYGFGPKRVESIPHAISMALNKFLAQMEKLPGQQLLTKHVGSAAPEVKEQTPQQNTKEHCPKCYSPNVARLSGCSGPTCYECGHSECS